MKKINSELKYDNDIFKIKIGTTDKKNPQTIYIEIGTYISPKEEKNSYKTDIFYLDSELKKYTEKLLQDSQFLKREFIFVTDCPYERIIKGKNSYLEFQLFIKPFSNISASKKFSEISKTINEIYIEDIINVIKSKLDSIGFCYCKTRK